MNVPFRIATGAAAVALLGSLAACGSSSSTSTSSSPSPAAAVGSNSSTSNSTQPLAEVRNLTGVHTQVMLDSNFVSALQTLKLTPGTVGSATLENGTLTFPITGGNVKYYAPNGPVQPYVQGIIDHQGSGISLAGGGTTVKLTNFEIDPGASKLFGDVDVNGQTAAKHAYLFFLDGSTLKPLQTPTPDTAVLEGTKVEVSPDAAQVLNKVFSTTAVQPNLLVGTAKITIATGGGSGSSS